MNPGTANISRNVANLPHQLTSMRGMWNTSVATAIIAPTSTSRMTMAQQNHSGAAPATMMPNRATMNSKRSTVGSKTLPNSLTCPRRRAR